VTSKITSLLTLAGIPHRTPKKTRRAQEIENRANAKSVAVPKDVEEYLADLDG